MALPQVCRLTIEELHQILLRSKLSIAVAESCTGGMLGSALTSLPGSSAYMLGGIIAYSNDVKTELLGVMPTLLSSVGAVSSEVAKAMAEGVRDLCHSDIGVAVTGVAGARSRVRPTRRGLIYICASSSSETRAIKLEGDHGREENRRQAVDAALELTARIASRPMFD